MILGLFIFLVVELDTIFGFWTELLDALYMGVYFLYGEFGLFLGEDHGLD